MSLLINDDINGMSGARANFYQGTAAIASWLSGLAQNSTAPVEASGSSAPVVPNVSIDTGRTPQNQFRSQVNAAATSHSASSSPSASPESSPYQMALAAYGDS